MHSASTIWIAATPDRVFDLVANLERWPEHLPHYRYVRILRRSHGAVRARMSARRGVLPVFWEAEQAPDAAKREIRFLHVGGVTRGMRVLWTLEPERGGTRARITHDLDLRWAVVGRFLAERLIAPQFIEPIARATLRRFKEIAEEPA